jgi:hypothetical protein
MQRTHVHTLNGLSKYGKKYIKYYEYKKEILIKYLFEEYIETANHNLCRIAIPIKIKIIFQHCNRS